MTENAWWRRGVIYQIYPRSFQDSDGDGIGDLAGIAQRLDHLVDLGVDAIWISPIFPSPMADFGYDVADYVDVDPLFGSLETFDALLAAAHARGLRLILDFVPNHTSDQHPWFLESRAGRASGKRDWYIWRDPRDGGPPNNWRSEFGGPAWTCDAASGQYHQHAYLAQQPDLDWRNAHVREAMLDVLRFWFARGVDGFRVDAVHHLVEDAALRDNPPNPDWRPGLRDYDRLLPAHTVDQPETQVMIAAMRRVADAFAQRVLIGEAYVPIPQLMAYYGRDGDGFQLPFNFHLISTPWRADALAALITEYEAALPPGAWPNWVLGNHDRARVASRIGGPQARVAAMLLLTLRGTPTIYQGEEIGMSDVAIPPDRVRDPWELNVPGLGLGRDPVRTPMPWDASAGGSFSTGEPWLPLGPQAARPVAAQAADPTSMLALYRVLLRLRRAHAALAVGAIEHVLHEGAVLSYERVEAGRRFLIVLNLDDAPRMLARPGRFEVTLSTHLDRAGEALDGAITLRAAEGLLLRPAT